MILRRDDCEHWAGDVFEANGFAIQFKGALDESVFAIEFFDVAYVSGSGEIDVVIEPAFE